MKVKIFTGEEDTIERRINEFLSSEDVSLVDIKYHYKDNSNSYRILVVYNEN